MPDLEPVVVGLMVRDVMITAPKTMSVDTTWDQAAAAFEDSHVHMLLLCEHGVLRGSLLREDLLPAVSGGVPVLPRAWMHGRTVGPDRSVTSVHRDMVTRGQRRLAVTGPGDTLMGLLCLKRSLTGFCSDAGVTARAREREA